MSIGSRCHHATRYSYDRRVGLGRRSFACALRRIAARPIASYRLDVQPEEHFLNWQQDPQSNWLARVLVPAPTDYLTVTVDLVADMAVINPFDSFLKPRPNAIRSLTIRRSRSNSHRTSSRNCKAPRSKRISRRSTASEQPTTSFVFQTATPRCNATSAT